MINGMIYLRFCHIFCLECSFSFIIIIIIGVRIFIIFVIYVVEILFFICDYVLGLYSYQIGKRTWQCWLCVSVAVPCCMASVWLMHVFSAALFMCRWGLL